MDITTFISEPLEGEDFNILKDNIRLPGEKWLNIHFNNYQDNYIYGTCRSTDVGMGWLILKEAIENIKTNNSISFILTEGFNINYSLIKNPNGSIEFNEIA